MDYDAEKAIEFQSRTADIRLDFTQKDLDFYHESLSSKVRKTKDGDEALAFQDLWDVAGDFDERVGDVLEEENPEPETEKAYVKSNLAALGTALGAEYQRMNVPEEDLDSEWRTLGFMAASLRMRTPILRNGVDLGVYGVPVDTVENIIRDYSRSAYTHRQAIEK